MIHSIYSLVGLATLWSFVSQVRYPSVPKNVSCTEGLLMSASKYLATLGHASRALNSNPSSICLLNVSIRITNDAIPMSA